MQLQYQGNFAVYRSAKSLDHYFPKSIDARQILARQRIKWVEITTAINQIHIAKIHFVDPEMSIVEAIVEAWNDTNRSTSLAEVWTAKVGYHDMPEPTWASFSGWPRISDISYPQKGPPTVTIVLFAPVSILKNNRSPMGVHFAYRPPSVRKALNAIADHYGWGLNLGSLDQVVTRVDDAFKAQHENPNTEIDQYFGGNRTLVAAYKKLSDLNKGQDMANDLLYLNAVVQELANIYIEILGDKTTTTSVGPVSDDLWSKVANADDQWKIDVQQGTLYCCLMKDMYSDLAKVTLYSYREGERTLLDFHVILRQVEGQTSVFSYEVKSDDYYKRTYGAVAARALAASTLLPPEAEIKVPAQQVESMNYNNPSDPAARDSAGMAAPTGVYIASSLTGRPLNQSVTLNWLLGNFATNISAECTVIGTPWMRAGRLVAITGLKRGPEVQATNDQPQAMPHLSRIYQVEECTHRVDETGFYKTTLKLRGATTDSSWLALVKAAAEGQTLKESDVKKMLSTMSKEGSTLTQPSKGVF